MAGSADDQEQDISELYQALPLDPAQDTFRILDILPCPSKKRDSEIHIALRTVSLSSAPYYEALSYTWGDSKLNRTVTVNEVYQLGVTDNLYNALRRLRRESEARTLWVDRVCIFQADNAERSEQVARMGKTYHHAALVNVWIGEPSGAIRSKLTVPLAAISAAPQLLVDSISLIPTRHMRRNAKKIADLWRAYRNILQALDQHIDSALVNTKPSWHLRAWVFQEFVLAKDVYLCCGPKRIRFTTTWFEFFDFFTPSSSALLRYKPGSPSKLFLDHLDIMQVFRFKIGDADHPELLEEHTSRFVSLFPGLESEVVTSFYDILIILSGSRRTVEASDPKDYLYSLLGLLDAEEAGLIRCNYSRSCSEIYAQATAALINHRRNFDIFDLVITHSLVPNLPSWSIDFSHLRRLTDPWQREHHKSNHSKSCLLNEISELRRPLASFDPRKGILSIPGTSVDVIVDVLVVNQSMSQRHGLLDEFVLKAINSSASATHDVNLITMMNAVYIMHSSKNVATAIQVPLELQPHRGLFRSTPLLFDFVWRAFELWTYLVAIEISSNKRAAESMLADQISKLTFSKSSELRQERRELRLFATSAGVLGVSPNSVAAGDSIALIRSHSPLVALRPAGAEYTFQGQVSLVCPMDEDSLRKWASLGMEEDTFVLR